MCSGHRHNRHRPIGSPQPPHPRHPKAPSVRARLSGARASTRRPLAANRDSSAAAEPPNHHHAFWQDNILRRTTTQSRLINSTIVSLFGPPSPPDQHTSSVADVFGAIALNFNADCLITPNCLICAPFPTENFVTSHLLCVCCAVFLARIQSGFLSVQNVAIRNAHHLRAAASVYLPDASGRHRPEGQIRKR